MQDSITEKGARIEDRQKEQIQEREHMNAQLLIRISLRSEFTAAFSVL
jgi:hypothetical protein